MNSEFVSEISCMEDSAALCGYYLKAQVIITMCI